MITLLLKFSDRALETVAVAFPRDGVRSCVTYYNVLRSGHDADYSYKSVGRASNRTLFIPPGSFFTLPSTNLPN